MEVVDVPGDGNCQIYAIRAALASQGRVQHDVSKMRAVLTAWLQENRRFLQPTYGDGTDPLKQTRGDSQLRSVWYKDQYVTWAMYLKEMAKN